MAKASPKLLEAQHISKAYSAAGRTVPVLKDISLSLYAGESLSLQGPSGVGKTTLVNLLSALDTPDEGEVYWNGTPTSQLPDDARQRERARFIGLVFQHYYLIPELTALENILIPKRILGKLRPEDYSEAATLLETMGVTHRQDFMPDQLSGGERQRIAIARALILKPSVIIADEPTGNLDEASGERVMQTLLEACQERNASLLLVTHNKAFAELTDRQERL